MRCSTCREAVSAQLDREDPGFAGPLVADHLERCASCRTFAHRADALHRRSTVRPAEPVPDLTGPILERARAAGVLPGASTPGGHWTRWALLGVGLVQLALALPALLGVDGGLPVHVARELGSWYLALAGALIAVALRPRHAAGLIPFAAGLAGAMAVSAVFDVVAGRTTLAGESQHLIDLVGLALLVAISRRAHDDGSLLVGLRRPRAAALG